MTLESKDTPEGEAAPRALPRSPGAALRLALIASQLDVPRDIETLLRRHGRVVHFPSLSQFCASAGQGELWTGVLIARACSWDARLDAAVSERRRIALFGRALERTWPPGVRRLGQLAAAEAWLSELASVRAPRTRASAAHARAGSLTHSAGSEPVHGRPSAPSAAPRSPLARGGYLLLGQSAEATLGLLRTLRRARPTRHAHSLAELPPDESALHRLTGVLFLHQPCLRTSELLPDGSLAAVWRSSPQGVNGLRLRSIEEESGLLAWMAHTLAFERTGSAALAHGVELVLLEYGLSPQQAEVLAVCTSSAQLEERAARLAMTLRATRGALKALSDAARGTPVPKLVARVLESAKRQ